MTTDMRARIRDGDPDAFGELFDSYARAVYNHAFRLTADWAVAEDVMSAAFMEAWKLRAKVDSDGGSLLPWLLGVTTNVARNHCRSNRRYRAAAAAAAWNAETKTPDHAEKVAGQMDDRRRISAALTALSALRRPEREVLLLCLLQGMDYADVARSLGIPIGTVRSRVSRARKKLRKLTDTELAAGKREPGALPRQVKGDRVEAVRSAQKGMR